MPHQLKSNTKKKTKTKRVNTESATAAPLYSTSVCTRIPTKLSQEAKKAKADRKLGYIPNMNLSKAYELVKDISGYSGAVTMLVKPRASVKYSADFDLAVVKFFPYNYDQLIRETKKTKSNKVTAEDKKIFFKYIFKEIVLVCYLSKNAHSAPYCAKLYAYGNTPTTNFIKQSKQHIFENLKQTTVRQMLTKLHLTDSLEIITAFENSNNHSSALSRLGAIPGFFMTIEYMEGYVPMYDLELIRLSDHQKMVMLIAIMAGMVAISKALNDPGFFYHDLHPLNLMVNQFLLSQPDVLERMNSHVSPVKFIDFESIKYTDKSIPFWKSDIDMLKTETEAWNQFTVRDKTSEQLARLRYKITHLVLTSYPLDQQVITIDELIQFLDDCSTLYHDTNTTLALKIIAFTVTKTIKNPTLKHLLNEYVVKAVIPQKQKRKGVLITAAYRPYDFLLERVNLVWYKYLGKK